MLSVVDRAVYGTTVRDHLATPDLRDSGWRVEMVAGRCRVQDKKEGGRL